MRLFPNTSTWPPNYRFAYLLMWAGAFIASGAAIAQGIWGADKLALGILIVVAIYPSIASPWPSSCRGGRSTRARNPPGAPRLSKRARS